MKGNHMKADATERALGRIRLRKKDFSIGKFALYSLLVLLSGSRQANIYNIKDSKVLLFYIFCAKPNITQIKGLR
jgi:hypothetical protein